jgi:hypothetical protein
MTINSLKSNGFEVVLKLDYSENDGPHFMKILTKY